jgi:hypothetical protein
MWSIQLDSRSRRYVDTTGWMDQLEALIETRFLEIKVLRKGWSANVASSAWRLNP